MSSPRIDAAALAAVPAHSPSAALRAEAATAADLICRQAMGGEAYLSHVMRSEYGKIGFILIPVSDVDLFKDKQRSLTAALKGVELAAALGAKCVSFTGMIPAATDYARTIASAVEMRAAENPDLKGLQLTTGHAGVVAAFALNIDSLLEFAGRRYPDERVAFVGLGSIGEGTARLMSNRRAPRHIYLVDVEKKKSHLEGLKADLTRNSEISPSQIDVVTVEAEQSLPADLYPNVSLILSATSSPEVIDIDALAPGTLIVDDSFPLGYNTYKAVRRMQGPADIMITIAGAFQGRAEFTLDHVPAGPDDPGLDLLRDILPRIANPWPNCLTGCVYSAHLTPHFDLPETIGPATADDAQRFYDTLRRHGFRGTPPYFFTFGMEREDPIFSLEKPRPLPSSIVDKG
ncbi:MAG: hypothetical protein QF521_20685 [Alphaproteobacteria bacterium]|nr:hypothetical protein [Alphaproteobacteria bacterium]